MRFKGKDMYFRWRRQNRDRTGSDQTGLDHGSDHRKKSSKEKKIQNKIRNVALQEV